MMMIILFLSVSFFCCVSAPTTPTSISTEVVSANFGHFPAIARTRCPPHAYPSNKIQRQGYPRLASLCLDCRRAWRPPRFYAGSCQNSSWSKTLTHPGSCSHRKNCRCRRHGKEDSSARYGSAAVRKDCRCRSELAPPPPAGPTYSGGGQYRHGFVPPPPAWPLPWPPLLLRLTTDPWGAPWAEVWGVGHRRAERMPVVVALLNDEMKC